MSEILNNIITKYNDSFNENKESNLNTELEITFHLVKSKNIYQTIFNKLKDLSSSIIINEYINIYYENNIKLIKQFKNGQNMDKDIYLKKHTLSKTYNGNINSSVIKKYNIKLKLEETLDNLVIKNTKLNNIKIVNIKLRLSFILKDKPFRIDLDLIKNINLKENNLKEIKNRIFKEYKLSNIIDEINYELFDELILETEFLNDKELNTDTDNTDLDKAVKFVQNIFNDSNTISSNVYQDYIYLIATFIISNKNYLENFKFKSGLKKLLNNVIEMNSELYIKNIKPQIENFYVTDKIDGQRCIIIYDEECNNNNNKKNIKLITNKVYQIKEYNDDIKTSNYTILDSEFLIPEELKNQDIISFNDIKLYIFDIIALNNKTTSDIPFEDRYKLINDGYNKVKIINAECKEYIKLTKNYKQELEIFYNKKKNSKNYKIDGLIFTPTSMVNNTTYKYKINSNYNNMIGYKWKPIEEITIDFYIKELPKNLYDHYPYNDFNTKSKTIYILFSGISKQDFDKLNMTYLTNYTKIIPEEFINKNYFPIQFSTSDKPINYIYISDNNKLDGLIGEFLYSNDKWELKKIRLDRTVELNRGEYFGNYFKIAELIWNNIKNPLTFDMLISDSDSNYFLVDDNELYKALRSYNSFIKSYLLETVINPKLTDKNNKEWIIDLASGKGQDLGRINNLGFKNGIFLDNDKNALMELINRKFNLRSSQQKNMKIYTQEINLTTNFKSIIKSLEKFNVSKESVDIIICNFAIHYIISQESDLINLIQLLNYYLKPNGRFIFTCFNGQKIFNLLNNSNEWNLYENEFLKYSIKKLYNSNDKLNNTGQKIDVLLPFSNNKYYSEYLINLDYVTNIFNDNNFVTEISESFSCLLNNFKNNKLYTSLTKYDKEFIDLYQFTILKKNYNQNIIIKSNLAQFFNCSEFKGSNNIDNIDTTNNNYLKLDQLDNINNVNSILLIINSSNETIINLIIQTFENMNYKNKNIFKRHRNKIIKILASDTNNWYNIYKLYTTNLSSNFDSIIFYDYNTIINEEYNKYIIKNPIIPIIISDNNNNNILIFNSNDLKNLTSNKYISNKTINYDNINNIIHSDAIIEFKKSCKTFDIYN